MMQAAIQIMEGFDSEQEARTCLDGLLAQEGCFAGRIIPPSPAKPRWRVQAFQQNEGEPTMWLPDGMRHVTLPDALLALCEAAA